MAPRATAGRLDGPAGGGHLAVPGEVDDRARPRWRARAAVVVAVLVDGGAVVVDVVGGRRRSPPSSPQAAASRSAGPGRAAASGGAWPHGGRGAGRRAAAPG